MEISSSKLCRVVIAGVLCTLMCSLYAQGQSRIDDGTGPCDFALIDALLERMDASPEQEAAVLAAYVTHLQAVTELSPSAPDLTSWRDGRNIDDAREWVRRREQVQQGLEHLDRKLFESIAAMATARQDDFVIIAEGLWRRRRNQLALWPLARRPLPTGVDEAVLNGDLFTTEPPDSAHTIIQTYATTSGDHARRALRQVMSHVGDVVSEHAGDRIPLYFVRSTADRVDERNIYEACAKLDDLRKDACGNILPLITDQAQRHALLDCAREHLNSILRTPPPLVKLKSGADVLSPVLTEYHHAWWMLYVRLDELVEARLRDAPLESPSESPDVHRILDEMVRLNQRLVEQILALDADAEVVEVEATSRGVWDDEDPLNPATPITRVSPKHNAVRIPFDLQPWLKRVQAANDGQAWPEAHQYAANMSAVMMRYIEWMDEHGLYWNRASDLRRRDRKTRLNAIEEAYAIFDEYLRELERHLRVLRDSVHRAKTDDVWWRRARHVEKLLGYILNNSIRGFENIPVMSNEWRINWPELILNNDALQAISIEPRIREHWLQTIERRLDLYRANTLAVLSDYRVGALTNSLDIEHVELLRRAREDADAKRLALHQLMSEAARANRQFRDDIFGNEDRPVTNDLHAAYLRQAVYAREPDVQRLLQLDFNPLEDGFLRDAIMRLDARTLDMMGGILNNVRAESNTRVTDTQQTIDWILSIRKELHAVVEWHMIRDDA